MYRIYIILIAFLFEWLFNNEDNPIRKNINKRNSRLEALKAAKMYLKPYKKIFGDFGLSNKFCSVRYLSGNKIFCMNMVADEEGRNQIFTAQNFIIMSIDDFFNRLCHEFTFHTTYHNVLYSCGKHCIDIDESYVQSHASKLKQTLKKSPVPSEIIDINNCSEAELTALPGISIVIAKKIIKFREEKRPFKSVDDFIKKMNIKPHFAKQLRAKLCANKINMKKVKKVQQERIIDI